MEARAVQGAGPHDHHGQRQGGAEHRRVRAGLKVSFVLAEPCRFRRCDPNRHVNGPARGHPPKGIGHVGIDPPGITLAGRAINHGPRKVLDCRTPQQWTAWDCDHAGRKPLSAMIVFLRGDESQASTRSSPARTRAPCGAGLRIAAPVQARKAAMTGVPDQAPVRHGPHCPA